MIDARFNSEEFFENFWEKKIYHHKEFISPQDILNKSDLEKMLLDEYYESRLIVKDQDSFRQGLRENYSDILKDKNLKWTAFIHNLQLYNPHLDKLVKELSEFPLWAFDDVLCSYSNSSSTVGAHYDDYNVLIIQLDGKREWKTQNNPIKAFREDSDIKVLKEFTPDNSIILNPGDMIYIPPHVAHQGTSLSESLSISIGFKSIEFSELAKKVAFDLIESPKLKHQLYKFNKKDSKLTQNILPTDEMKNIKKELLAYLQQDNYIEKALLKHLSKNKYALEYEVESEISENSLYYKNEHSKLKILKDNQTNLYAIDEYILKLSKDESISLESLFETDINQPVNNFLFKLEPNTQSFLIKHGVVFCE